MLATCEVLRGLAYSTARSACPPRRADAFGTRACDDDDLVFDSPHKVLFLSSAFHFLNFLSVSRGLRIAFFLNVVFEVRQMLSEVAVRHQNLPHGAGKVNGDGFVLA